MVTMTNEHIWTSVSNTGARFRNIRMRGFDTELSFEEQDLTDMILEADDELNENLRDIN